MVSRFFQHQSQICGRTARPTEGLWSDQAQPAVLGHGVESFSGRGVVDVALGGVVHVADIV